jgi:GntR family transcriptional regulator/MocR family aminotransferase
VEAYDQLLAEGYVTARRGSATRVATRQTTTGPAAPREPSPARLRYDFRPGLPDPALFPRRAWLASLRRVMSVAPDAALDYPDPRGAEPARTALSTYLNRARGTVARAD